MKPVSERRRRRDRVYPARRRAVSDRADGRCEVHAALNCTGRCEQVHHRAGRLGPDPHRLENLVGCCAPCHRVIHANPEWAREHGYSVSRLALVSDFEGEALPPGGAA